MDFLSRLIGAAASAPSKKASGNNPQQRLNRFKKIYSQTLQTWHKIHPISSSNRSDTVSASNLAAEQSILTGLERLSGLLHDDTRTPPPHLCLSFAASSHVYIGIARVALSLRSNEAVLLQTLSFLTILVDTDEENLVGTQRFAENLTTFIDGLIGPDAVASVSPEVEEKALELIFGIAAKIRLDSALLPLWFRGIDNSTSTTRVGKVGGISAPPATSEQEAISFPLCYEFVGHVHNEGRAGDFARTGLLYVFECASGSAKLESWIIDSDLPTLMASGLGALYSQLARKLAIGFPQGELPLILALSDNEKRTLPDDVETFYSNDLQTRLSTFMSYLVFWQDVLERCRSTEIQQTLVDHFQVFFLQQILYPSLLESSDHDGGSSVAVLTYLWRILDSVGQPDLIHLILHYLLALPEPLAAKSDAKTVSSSGKKRKSLFDANSSAIRDDGINPSLFNLVDMILTSVQSSNPQTITAGLRLVGVVLSKHHPYATSTLLRTIPVREATMPRPIGALDQEMRCLLSLACEIGSATGVDESFENSLKDALNSVEAHMCSQERMKLPGAKPNSQGKANEPILVGKADEMQDHFLDPEDPLFKALTEILMTFFTNDIEINLGMTNVFAQMASCPFARLDKWLAMDALKLPMPADVPSVPTAQNVRNDPVEEDERDELKLQDEQEEARLLRYRAARRLPKLSSDNTPSLIKSLQILKAQLDDVRKEFPEFDDLLAGRKRAFQGATEIENELENNSPLPYNLFLSAERSRESSVSRQFGSGTNTPSRQATSQMSGFETPGSIQRGRAPSALATHGGSTTPKSSPKPASTDNKAYRPSSLQSPALRPRDRSRGTSHSPSKAHRALSPLKATHFPPGIDMSERDFSTPVKKTTEVPTISASQRQAEDEEIFEKKVSFSQRHRPEDLGGEDLIAREATLTHVLTNTVILQDFILELAAIIQTRASLLDCEVRFL